MITKDDDKIDDKKLKGQSKNEFNTIEYSGDEASSPAKYIKKLQEILSFPGVSGMSAAIGLQGHFASGQPNLAYMRSGLDLLATTVLPIWLTEASVDPQPSQVFPQLQKIFQ